MCVYPCACVCIRVRACVCVCVYTYACTWLGSSGGREKLKHQPTFFFFLLISQFIRKALVKDTDEQLDERCAGRGLWGTVWCFHDSPAAPLSRCAPIWKL